MTKTQTLRMCSINDLVRAYKTQRNYIYFTFTFCDTTQKFTVKLNTTDKYKIEQYTWNGLNYIIENDKPTKFLIREILNTILIHPKIKKTKDEINKIERILNKII